MTESLIRCSKINIKKHKIDGEVPMFISQLINTNTMEVIYKFNKISMHKLFTKTKRCKYNVKRLKHSATNKNILNHI